jgi:molybdopterin synthase sulfur carrier subunit
MKLLYFAWIRLKMGVSGEHIDPPQNIKDIEGLLDWIKQRNAISNETFSDISNIRIAVNQEYVDTDHPVQPGDEVAFFPPVTGG